MRREANRRAFAGGGKGTEKERDDDDADGRSGRKSDSAPAAAAVRERVLREEAAKARTRCEEVREELEREREAVAALLMSGAEERERLEEELAGARRRCEELEGAGATGPAAAKTDVPGPDGEDKEEGGREKLRADLAAARTRADELTEAVRAAEAKSEEERERSDEEREALAAELAAVGTRCAALVEEAEGLRAGEEAGRQRHLQELGEVRDRLSEAEERGRELEEALAGNVEGGRRKVATLEEKLQRSRTRAAALRVRLRRREGKLGEAEKKAARARARFEAMERSLERARCDSSNSQGKEEEEEEEVEEMRRTLSETTARCRSLEADLVRLRAGRARTAAALERRRGHWRGEMAKARVGHEALEERLRLSECALEDLATVHGRERIELGGRIGTLTELLQESRSVTAPSSVAVREDRASLEGQCEALREGLERARLEREEAAAARARENARMAERIAELRREREEEEEEAEATEAAAAAAAAGHGRTARDRPPAYDGSTAHRARELLRERRELPARVPEELALGPVPAPLRNSGPDGDAPGKRPDLERSLRLGPGKAAGKEEEKEEGRRLRGGGRRLWASVRGRITGRGRRGQEEPSAPRRRRQFKMPGRERRELPARVPEGLAKKYIYKKIKNEKSP